MNTFILLTILLLLLVLQDCKNYAVVAFPKLYLLCNMSEESLLQELDIEDVFQQFLSKECKLSYCDLILANQTSKASIGDAVGDANVLISSSPDHNFLDVLDILAYHFKDEPNKVIWFDLFSLN